MMASAMIVSSPEKPSTSSRALSNEQEKLARQLREFDVEVHTKAEKMRTQLKALVLSIRSSFSVELIKIPKKTRVMTVSEFVEKYGSDLLIPDSGAPGASSAGSCTDSAPQSVAPMDVSGQPHAANVSLMQSQQLQPLLANPLDTSILSLNTPAPASRKVGQPAGGNPFAGPAAVGPNVAGTVMKPYAPLGAPIWSATPLHTPKIDPRLLPPASTVRTARAGEMVMSLNGSPLSVQHETDTGVPCVRASIALAPLSKQPSAASIITVPLAQGKALELDVTKCDKQALDQLSKKDKRAAFNNLKLLQSQVDMLMQQLAK